MLQGRDRRGLTAACGVVEAEGHRQASLRLLRAVLVDADVAARSAPRF